MRIALCDDDALVTEQLSQLIARYAFDRNVEMTCERFEDGHVLLDRDKFDLYILDYKMDRMDGIELAKELKRKYCNAVTVCFLTGYETAAAQIINGGVHADGFLKKPIDPKQLGDKLDQFYRLSFFNRFELRQGKRYRTIYAQDVLYAEANDKQTRLHGFNGSEDYNYLLRDVESILPAGLFFRIHRSYLINLQYVDSYDAKSVTLKNGETLPLKAKDFQQAYRRFMFLFNH